MASKRSAPPPPPPQESEESSSEQTGSGEEEEETEPTPATQKPHQSSKSPSTATDGDATADSSEGSDEESSDSESDAEAIQLRQVAPAADEEQGKPSEPLQKKQPMDQAGRKRQATETTPSGKSKKAKPAPSPKADANKAKATKKAVPDPSASSKSKRWTNADEIKILEAFIGHVKTKGAQPGALDLIAAVGDTLDRKNCTKVEMYEKVRNLRKQYDRVVSTGTLPVKDDDLHKFKLSEVAWGQRAKEVASASIARNDAASPKSKKAKIQGDTKGRSSKKAAATDTLAKSEKQGTHKMELDDIVTAKDTTATTDSQIGATLVRSNRGKSDREKMGGDADCLGPKEDIDANLKSICKGFDELQSLYPNLSSCVERIKDQHQCGQTMKRAFGFIGDQKARTLESKIKMQMVAEVKMKIRRADSKKEVANLLIGSLD